jgi:hypothetical protein
MGLWMRLYIIGIMIGAIGLVAANQVRAEERCGVVDHTVPMLPNVAATTVPDN